MGSSTTLSGDVYRLFTHPEHQKYFPHIRADYVRRAVNEERIVTVYEGTQLIGVIIYMIYSTSRSTQMGNRGDIQLAQIVIHPDYYGSGVANLLFDQLVSLGNDIGSRRIVLSVRKENERAIAFYKKLGMECIGEKSWSYGTIPGWIFEYKLDPPIPSIFDALIEDIALESD